VIGDTAGEKKSVARRSTGPDYSYSAPGQRSTPEYSRVNPTRDGTSQIS
jgi:hypothetical protein